MVDRRFLRVLLRGLFVPMSLSLLVALGHNSPCHAAPPDFLGLDDLERRVIADVASARDPSASTSDRFILAPQPGATEVPAEDRSARREQLLEWVSDFELRQELFPHSQVSGLRAALATLSEAELDRWDVRTQLLRERLTDDSWLLTQKWLHDFFAAQAIYSPQRIAELRAKLATLTPLELLKVIEHFELVYRARVRNRLAADAFRPRAMELGSRRRLTSSNFRAATFSTGEFYPTVPQSAQRTAAREYPWGSRYSLSRRVARYYVRREVLGPGWWLFW